jgi:L-alanine-DL-glutamate epimerase-like enolase superfamily enzyme
VRGALKLIEPLLLGENALEPERVTEKLHQHTFWQGRGGSVTHAISGIDIALWDLPLSPDALQDYVRLRDHSKVPIAGGEVLTRRQSFQPWLEAGAFDIVQPDVTKVGGISEERRIAWMAREHGVRFIPHGWNTAIGLAADLQLASAFPDTDLVEYLNGSPFIDEIVTDPWRLDQDGMLPIPSAPGLGLKLNREVVAKYTHGERLFD